MKSLDKVQKLGNLENFALDQTEQFLKPQTFLDLIFSMIVVFWWLSSVLFQDNTTLRALMFFFVIGLFFFIPLYTLISKDRKSTASLLNRATKAVISFILILFFTSNKQPDPDIWRSLFPTIVITYAEVERLMICLLIPISLLMNGFSIKTLKFGYLQYLGKIFQGFWLAVLVIFVFKGINLYIPVSGVDINLEFLFLIAYGAFLLGNLFPGSTIVSTSSLTASNLFDQYMALKTRTERLRDALFIGSFVLIIFLLLPNWITTYRQLFQYFAFIGLVIGIMLIFIPKSDSKQRFTSVINSLTGISIDPSSHLGSRVQDFAHTIRNTNFQTPEKVYTISTDGMKLVSKGKTTLKAAAGSILVPNVTEKGTVLVLMGKSEVKTESEDKKTLTKEIDGTTTLWIPQDEWEDIELQLDSKNMVDLTENEILSAGLKSTTEIFEKARKAFEELKSWKGPRGLFNSVLDDTTTSKYSITETKDYSLVKLPGIYVFESEEIELVNIFGGLVKVIEIKGVGEYVQVFGGFVTVLQTPDYDFVQTPFVSVLDTPKGEIVKIFGMKIQEGEAIDITEARKRIIADQQRFTSLFSRKIEVIFQEDPHLLLTEFKGEKLGFIVGKDEVLGDIENIKKSSKKRRERAQKHKKKRFHVQTQTMKVVPPVSPVPVAPSTFEKKSQKSELIELDLNSDHQELNDIKQAIKDIELSIDKIDLKLINDEISESKHTEMIKRLEMKQESLIKKKNKLENDLKVKFI